MKFLWLKQIPPFDSITNFKKKKSGGAARQSSGGISSPGFNFSYNFKIDVFVD